MVHGMLHAGRALDRAQWIASARRALDFLRSELWRDGRLLATFKDGRAHLNAYLDDHAFLLAALLEFVEVLQVPQRCVERVFLAIWWDGITPHAASSIPGRQEMHTSNHETFG